MKETTKDKKLIYELTKAVENALFILECNDLNDERATGIRKAYKKATGQNFDYKNIK